MKKDDQVIAPGDHDKFRAIAARQAQGVVALFDQATDVPRELVEKDIELLSSAMREAYQHRLFGLITSKFGSRIEDAPAAPTGDAKERQEKLRKLLTDQDMSSLAVYTGSDVERFEIFFMGAAAISYDVLWQHVIVRSNIFERFIYRPLFKDETFKAMAQQLEKPEKPDIKMVPSSQEGGQSHSATTGLN